MKVRKQIAPGIFNMVEVDDAPPRAIAPTVLSCSHLGKETGETVNCKSCGGGVNLKVFACAVHEGCTIGKKATGLACCKDCPDHSENARVKPTREIAINLPTGHQTGHFNCSIIEYYGRTLLASRLGWVGKLHLSELDADYQVVRTWPLDTKHPQTLHGSEDPRLFIHRGILCVSFSGYAQKSPMRTSMLYASLNADASAIEEVFFPQLAGRQPMEKNWAFFDHDGALHSVYTVGPQHTILMHHGNKVGIVAQSPCPIKMPGYHLRGGAAPVLVGDEYYHFFHTVRGSKDYGMGLYAFSAKPPFEIKRWSNSVIFRTEEKTEAGYRIVFPCGAMLRDGQWVISYGYNDTESRVAMFDQAEIESLLI